MPGLDGVDQLVGIASLNDLISASYQVSTASGRREPILSRGGGRPG
jgi:hypothetical protein